MFSDSDPSSEASGNDGVEQHEDKERQPEKQTDDGKKEDFSPWKIYISCAGGVVRVILIISNCQDGGGEEDGEQPGDEADHPCLALCPDQASTQGQTHCIVPGEDDCTNW